MIKYFQEEDVGIQFSIKWDVQQMFAMCREGRVRYSLRMLETQWLYTTKDKKSKPKLDRYANYTISLTLKNKNESKMQAILF